MEWISVKDKLPIPGVSVIVYSSSTHFVRTDWQIHTRNGMEWANYMGVTHWMPLPEAPHA